MRAPGRSTSSLALALAGFLAAAGAGCGAGGYPPPPPGGVPMTLGTIDASGGFLSLVAGQDVELVSGAQGGFHVWMKFRVLDMPPAQVDVSRLARRQSDGASVLRSPPSRLVIGEPDESGMWELPNPATMFMCPTPIGIRVADEPIVYEIQLSQGGQMISQASIVLVPHCPQDAQREFCMRICVG